MAKGNGEPKGRTPYAYVVLAYSQPPVMPGEEIVQREDLLYIGVFEAPTHEDAAQQAAEQFPPRVGEQRTFVATLASKWREFDFGTETRVEVKGTEAQTHPTKGLKVAESTPYEDPGASAHPPEPEGDPDAVQPVEVEPPGEHHFLDENAPGIAGITDGDDGTALPGEDEAA